ncbi:MAG TPA: hypothetical protein VJ722_12485 [Rhodanobacteraceae bacterium]|nr:hypothetical protein [Rhodanobacteraceae bacterium]
MRVDAPPHRRENIRVAILRGIRSTQAKVMDVHPSRTAVVCLHRMTAANNQSFACGNRTGSAGTFLD